MNPLFRIDFSISDSLKIVRKSVLIYETIIGALALRNQINELIDGICKEGYKNICWLGIGGTYASCLQAEVHMKEKSKLSFFVENAAEYLTTGNK